MSTLKKNFKKITSGVMLLSILVTGGYSLAELKKDKEEGKKEHVAETKDKTAVQARRLAWNQDEGEYQLVTDYDPENCVAGSRNCTFTTTAPTSQVPNNIPASEIQSYVDQGLIVSDGTSNRQYLF